MTAIADSLIRTAFIGILAVALSGCPEALELPTTDSETPTDGRIGDAETTVEHDVPQVHDESDSDDQSDTTGQGDAVVDDAEPTDASHAEMGDIEPEVSDVAPDELLDSVSDQPTEDIELDEASDREIDEEVEDDAATDPDSGGDPEEPEVPCERECGDRECGDDPICGESCGTCDTPGLNHCNDGVCEYRCVDDTCEEQTTCDDWFCETESFCDVDGTDFRDCQEFSCSDDRLSCLQAPVRQEGEPCEVETNGLEVPDSKTLHECANFSDTCDESGTQGVTAHICRAGEPNHELLGFQSCHENKTGEFCEAEGEQGVCFDGSCCVDGGIRICPE